MQDLDMVIVGGGMVGLALALALKDSALRIAIIEPKPPASIDLSAPYDLRVSALSLSSQRLLEQLGVWQAISQMRAHPYHSMDVWEKDSFAKINFKAEDLVLPQLGHTVENQVIRQALWQQVSQQTNVSILETEISQLHRGERGAWLNLADGQVLNCRLLVAADGANSWLREQLDVPLTFWDYQHSAIVANIRSAEPHNHCARQVFSPEGPLAFLPLADETLCSIVWSVRPEQAEKLSQLPVAEFNKALTMAFDHRLGLCQREGELACFPLRMRYARDFAGEGFALIGDAAHTVHPLAGQGVNLGLMDAAALAEQVQATLQAGLDIGAYSNLRHFERWRKSEASQMIAAMEGFKRLFGNDIAPLKLLRGIGMSGVDRLSPLKHQAMKRALGLSGDLPQLAR